MHSRQPYSYLYRGVPCVGRLPEGLQGRQERVPRALHSFSLFGSRLRYRRRRAREQVVVVDVTLCGGLGCASPRRDGS